MSQQDVYRLLADDIASNGAKGDAGDHGDVWETITHLVDPTELRPKLADDIEIRVFEQRWGEGYVMIANPRDLLHFRLAASDLGLLQLMDGTRTVKEIVVERFEESGEMELSTVIDLVRSLYRGNFLEQRHVDVPSMVTRAMDPVTDRRRKARQFGKTLSIEWEGAHRLVQWIYDHGLKWVFKPLVLLVLIATAIVGLGAFVDILRHEQFVIAGRSLAIGFVVLIVLDYVMVFCHELGHALVIVHNGRRIRSAGFQIYFGSPAFFVESSDGLMMDRRKQIIESFAGPFAQLVLAGIASLIAWGFPGWILSETMYKFAVLNYLVVIMNLIPLLELDGYYILADLIEIPDLRERSLVFMRRDLFHKLRTRERFSKRDAGLALYGVLGIAFTIFSLYTAYFYWQTVFGDLVSRLWQQGPVTRMPARDPRGVHRGAAAPRSDQAAAGDRPRDPRRLAPDPVPSGDRLAGRGVRADRRAPDVRGHPGRGAERDRRAGPPARSRRRHSRCSARATSPMRSTSSARASSRWSRRTRRAAANAGCATSAAASRSASSGW